MSTESITEKALRRLKDQAEKTRSKGQYEKALESYMELSRLDSVSPRWPQMTGDLQQRLGRVKEAVESYVVACDRYLKQGLEIKALALARVILGLAPGNQRALALLGTPPSAARSVLDQKVMPQVPRRSISKPPSEPAASEAGIVLAEPKTSPHTGGSSQDWQHAFSGFGEIGSHEQNKRTKESSPGYRSPAPPASKESARTPLPSARGRIAPPPIPKGASREAGSPSPLPLSSGKARPPPIPVASARPPAKAPSVRPSGSLVLEKGQTLDGLDLSEVMGGSESDAFKGDRRDMAQEMKAASESWSGQMLEEVDTSVVRAVNACEIPLDVEVDVMLDRIFPGTDHMGGTSEQAKKRTPVSVGVHTPLFGELEHGPLTQLVSQMKELGFPRGAEIVREGEPGGALFVVVEGKAGVYRKGPPEVKVGEIEEGSFFGEIALITNQPRHATVRADTDIRLLEISRDLAVELIQDHPEVVSVLMRFFRRRMVEILLKTSPLFTSLDNEKRKELARRCKFLEADPGTRFIKQGRPTPGLFVLLSGTAEVATTEEGAGRFLARLSTGDLVGEAALLPGRNSTVSVTATEKCWMIYIPAPELRQAASTIPQVVTYLMNLTEKRRRAATAGLSAVKQDYPVERLPVW